MLLFVLHELTVLILLVVDGVSAQTDEECTNFVFNIRFDAFPSDFSLELTENGSSDVVWARSGFDDETHKYEVVSDSICLDPSRCWKVTLFDSVTVQDGLTKTDNDANDPGAYVLVFGTTTIGMYDAAASPLPCYEQHWYVFGDGCEMGSAPSQGKVGGEMCNPDIDEDLCVQFQLMGTTDEFPEDTRYVLEGLDGDVVWDDSPFDQTHQNVDFQRVTCLDPTLCYRFSFHDSVQFPNGLTDAPDGGTPGSFNFSLNGEIIGSYTGATDGCFQEMWYEFGYGCPGGASSGKIGSENCKGQGETEAANCKVVEFTMLTDEFPEEVSYALISSNGTEIWKEQPFDAEDQNIMYVKLACVEGDDCYTFSISDDDALHDGLSSAPVGGVAGWFRLQYDFSNIAYYDGMADGCYKSMMYTFGGACEGGFKVDSMTSKCVSRNETEEVKEEKKAGCVGFQLLMTTDEFPEDSMLLLEDSKGQKLWNDRPWNQRHVGRTFDRDICLNPLDCYNFTLFDSATHGDGLTSAPDGGLPGRFNITFGRDMIDNYDGSRDGFFSSKWYLFGEGCQTTAPMHGTMGSERNVFTEQSVGTSSPLCKDFAFNIALDEFPEDVVLSLKNESDYAIWDEKRPWDQRHVGDSFTESICLDPEECYTFTVEDRFSDGLTDETEHGPGKFTVVWGTTVLDSYRGEECYSSKWYKFGNLCSLSMGSLGKSCQRDFLVKSAEECVEFVFTIEADMFPEDITFDLTDISNATVWEEEKLESSTTRSECLPRTECYVFTINDAFTDGLTKAPIGGQMGKFTLDYGLERIGYYNARKHGCFSLQTFTFGDGCPSFPDLISVSEVRTSGDCRDDDSR